MDITYIMIMIRINMVTYTEHIMISCGKTCYGCDKKLTGYDNYI